MEPRAKHDPPGRSVAQLTYFRAFPVMEFTESISAAG